MMKYIKDNIIILFVIVILTMTYISANKPDSTETYVEGESTKYYASNINSLNN